MAEQVADLVQFLVASNYTNLETLIVSGHSMGECRRLTLKSEILTHLFKALKWLDSSERKFLESVRL